MKLLVPLGTRPEIIKLSSVLGGLRRAGIEVRVVATGQHTDPRLAGSFLTDLAVEVDEQWTLPTAEAERVGALIAGAFAELADRRPDAVLALGDTYTVPAFALAARRHAVPFVHLEAGLRSFNDRSMEETNRRVAAATASIHLAPTELARSNLLREGVAGERISVVGNPVIDVLRRRGAVPAPVADRHGVLMTAHRSTNVDDRDRLATIVQLANELARKVGPVTFPVHPRTDDRLEFFGLRRAVSGGVTLCPPLPYDDLLQRLRTSKVVVTDSGGLQEEASWFGVPLVVLRQSTPRWEGVMNGTAVVCGVDLDAAMAAAAEFAAPEAQARVAAVPCPYGDGFTSERVPRVLRDASAAGLLSLRETPGRHLVSVP